MLKENQSENNLITFQNVQPTPQRNEFKNEIICSSIHESKGELEMLQNLKKINKIEITNNQNENYDEKGFINIENSKQYPEIQEECKVPVTVKGQSVSFADNEVNNMSPIKRSSFRYLDNNINHSNVILNLQGSSKRFFNCRRRTRF
jgi:hypothetical protein